MVLAFLPRAIAQRLEGSRFIRWQLYRLRAGGSRELPSAMFAHRVCSRRVGLRESAMWIGQLGSLRVFSENENEELATVIPKIRLDQNSKPD